MPTFGSGSNSNGQFWYGNTTNFPGFLYKKNVGVGGRRSTKFNPGGNITCNNSTYLYNKYKPGSGGIGASSTSNRRAKNRIATICQSNNCFPCYNSLGQYSNYTHNPNGYVNCLQEIFDGQLQTIVSTNGYIYSSSDYGNTWDIVYKTNNNFIFNIFSKRNDLLYQCAITDSQNPLVFESKNIRSWASYSNQPTLLPNQKSFPSITSSGDLKYQTFTIYSSTPTESTQPQNNTTFYSNNYGNTWNLSNYQLKNNLFLSSDYSGLNQLSGGYYDPGLGSVYYSNDYGNNWTSLILPKLPYQNNTTNTPLSSCISGDNSLWTICDYFGYIQYSQNQGKGWSISTLSINLGMPIGFIKSSYTGNTVVAINNIVGSNIQGYLYISYDKGATFNVPSKLFLNYTYWLSCDISSTGQIITALSRESINNDSNIYYYFSKDYGVTWKIINFRNLFNDNGIISIAVN
jgi:hypothetical protein